VQKAPCKESYISVTQ